MEKPNFCVSCKDSMKREDDREYSCQSLAASEMLMHKSLQMGIISSCAFLVHCDIKPVLKNEKTIDLDFL